LIEKRGRRRKIRERGSGQNLNKSRSPLYRRGVRYFLSPWEKNRWAMPEAEKGEQLTWEKFRSRKEWILTPQKKKVVYSSEER